MLTDNGFLWYEISNWAKENKECQHNLNYWKGNNWWGIGPLGLPFDTAFLEGESPHSAAGDDDAAPLVPYYYNYRKTSIYGGSNEIQKNIITQMILGL